MRFFCLKTILLFTLAIILLTGAGNLAKVQSQPSNLDISTVQFVPPSGSVAHPGRRQSGASRGGQCPAVDEPLTALVPTTKRTLDKSSSPLNTYQSAGGLTVANYPSLWFYNPYALTSKIPLEFVLEDEQGNYIYKTSFTASGTPPGILRVGLPSTLNPLVIGKMYHWYFLVNCTPDAPVSVDGWIQRVATTANLNQIEQEKPQQQIVDYATKGIWYNALTILAEQRLANPKNALTNQGWTSLLRSIGLDAIASVPLSRCCTLEQKVGEAEKINANQISHSQLPTKTKFAQ